MRQRWIIRGVFMLPILLCLFGWAWSYGHSDRVTYITEKWRWNVLSDGGSVGVLRNTALPVLVRGRGAGFTEDRTAAPHRHLVMHGDTEGLHFFLGFLYLHITWIPGVEQWGCAVPYYFLILLFCTSLLLVWRWTRARVPAGAFPVEAKGH